MVYSEMSKSSVLGLFHSEIGNISAPGVIHHEMGDISATGMAHSELGDTAIGSLPWVIWPELALIFFTLP